MNIPEHRIVKEFCEGLLEEKESTGMCFVVAWPLAGYLNFLGYDCVVTEGVVYKDFQHFWITLSCGTIIDATASQFNDLIENKMPPIYIGEKPDWYFVKEKR